MTSVLQPGATAVLSGLDANGLVTTQFPGTPSWSVDDTSLFTVTVSADGLSAQVVPTGTGGTTNLVVIVGDLRASVSIEFDVVAPPPPPPPTPGVATSIAITLTQN